MRALLLERLLRKFVPQMMKKNDELRLDRLSQFPVERRGNIYTCSRVLHPESRWDRWFYNLLHLLIYILIVCVCVYVCVERYVTWYIMKLYKIIFTHNMLRYCSCIVYKFTGSVSLDVINKGYYSFVFLKWTKTYHIVINNPKKRKKYRYETLLNQTII